MSTQQPQQRIRPIAVCVIWLDNRILVFEGHDDARNESFFRPLGGTIEFGERSADTVVRELKEEINAEVGNLQKLAVLENIFIYNGQPKHEIVYVYEGRFLDSSLYDKPEIIGQEADGSLLVAKWKALSDFAADGTPLYPDGLLEILKSGATLAIRARDDAIE